MLGTESPALPHVTLSFTPTSNHCLKVPVYTPLPLPAGCYDENYTDNRGRRAGDTGFVPPLNGVRDPDVRAQKAAGLPKGYDADYRDAQNLGPSDPGFVPPRYDKEYEDPNGRRVGEPSFVPPAHGTKGTFGGTRRPILLPLDIGCYDENYRDANGLKPGQEVRHPFAL